MVISRRIKRIDPKPSKRLTLNFNIARTIQRSPKQSGKIISVPRDASRTALPPGKRISKKGNVYWETRVNRSDLANRI